MKDIILSSLKIKALIRAAIETAVGMALIEIIIHYVN